MNPEQDPVQPVCTYHDALSIWFFRGVKILTQHIRQPLVSAPTDKIVDEAIFASGHKSYYRDTGKRIFDVALVMVAALPVLVILVILGVVIALDGKSPFYVQSRVGRNGRIFRMVKLRSMVFDADARLRAFLDYNPQARAIWDRDQKLQDDPRVTVIGRFIRKTSLDELPQLWNVLIGDMSLVGPRPMMVNQQELYPGTAYYALRPGITGFWQISVRNGSSFAARAGFDSAYLRKLSLKTDVAVLFRTVGAVLRGSGC